MSVNIGVTEKVFDAARTLAGQIGTSEAYLRFESALHAFQKNEEARDLLVRYRRAERSAQLGFSLDSRQVGIQDEVSSLWEQVQKNPILKEYFEAQESLIKELQELNAYISARLGFDFAALAKPAGGCCG